MSNGKMKQYGRRIDPVQVHSNHEEAYSVK
mgnify:CR=1 FL=1